jgi:hypothetical protein
MKYLIFNLRNFILLILLILNISIHGQTYNKLIEGSDKFWDISQYDGASICGYAGYPNRYFILGDTLINDLIYTKVYAYHFLQINPDYGECPPYLVDTNYYLSNIFIREDTLLQKVYKYFPEQDTDGLLFDFSLNIHDTLKYYGYQSGSIVITIDTIINIITGDGIERKQFFTNYGSSNYIEGIGGNQGPFELPLIAENDYSILCVIKNKQHIYGSYCYNFITEIEENFKLKTLIDIYPNPFTNSFTVSFNDNYDENVNNIELIDNLGETIIHENKIKPVNEFNVALDPGVYYIRISYLIGSIIRKMIQTQ